MPIEPDTKDWTWTLERACPECGFDAPALDLARVPDALRDNATLWEVVLGTDDAAVRPSPHVWSPLEYACHVRDVNRVFAGRVRQMLEDDGPTFANWDQDETAETDDYGSQDPATVAAEVVAAAEEVAQVYEGVGGDQWQRRGTRSNGDVFTVDTLARYHLHDVVHHAHDVSHVTKRVTVASYDAWAQEYAAGTAEMPGSVRDAVASFAARLPAGARVLEVGSAAGRDAEALEQAGLSVRRTDITPAFVAMLRAAGHDDAAVVDPLTDDLTDPTRDAPYDGVWASASLLHVRREDLPDVLVRLAGAVRPGGVLRLAVKEGDGARFSTHGHVGAPRHFTFWREDGLRAVLEEAGWEVAEVEHASGERDDWLDVTALRREDRGR
ncbi:class I SAM-dependent methyltransferase [Nocardioides taihuensis]|uniref:Class I SAM-dependent methyltransferase n=1 Tax=Nocardioides taihuensis TaxID=1835606 RepID=A0ABW0BQS0_9ACTN